MSYNAEISRANPACVLFLIDQSWSMKHESFGRGAPGESKADGVADAINKCIHTLIMRCAKDESIFNYFDVGVIGYGQDVGPAFQGALSGRELVSTSELAANPAKIDKRFVKESNGAGGVLEIEVDFPVWFEAYGENGTPMAPAFQQATSILTNWISKNPDSFPPILINITDGEFNEGGDPYSYTQRIMSMGTNNGNVLVFNIHLSILDTAPIVFPTDKDKLPDEYAEHLYKMSSPMPDFMVGFAQERRIGAKADSRCFVFNSDLITVIEALDIGTRKQMSMIKYDR